MKKGLMLCVLMLGAFPLYGQSAKSFNKFWTLATYNGKDASLLYMIEPQLRLIERPKVFDQSLINVAIGKEFMPSWEGWFGQTYIRYASGNAVADDVSTSDVNEYRLWQQLYWKKSYAKKEWALRSRLEERRAFRHESWAVRLRERGYWTLPLTTNQSLVLSDEFFINLKRPSWVVTKILDQNRAYIGILQKLTPSWSFNVSYMNQTIFRKSLESDHVMVLNFFFVTN